MITNSPPAHKFVGDTGKPGQVVYPIPQALLDIPSGRSPYAHKEDDDGASRLRLMYDTLFYNPVDRGI